MFGSERWTWECQNGRLFDLDNLGDSESPQISCFVSSRLCVLLSEEASRMRLRLRVTPALSFFAVKNGRPRGPHGRP